MKQSEAYEAVVNNLTFNGEGVATLLYQLKDLMNSHPNDAQQSNENVTGETVSPTYIKSRSGTGVLTIVSDEAVPAVLTLEAASFVGGFVATTVTITLVAAVLQRILLPLAYQYRIVNMNAGNTYSFYWDTTR